MYHTSPIAAMELTISVPFTLSMEFVGVYQLILRDACGMEDTRITFRYRICRTTLENTYAAELTLTGKQHVGFLRKRT